MGLSHVRNGRRGNVIEEDLLWRVRRSPSRVGRVNPPWRRPGTLRVKFSAGPAPRARFGAAAPGRRRRGAVSEQDGAASGGAEPGPSARGRRVRRELLVSCCE